VPVVGLHQLLLLLLGLSFARVGVDQEAELLELGVPGMYRRFGVGWWLASDPQVAALARPDVWLSRLPPPGHQAVLEVVAPTLQL
jgi:hypothetical protein